RRRHRNPQLNQSWNAKSTQPRINAGDCPCSICKGEPLKTSPAQIEAWQRERAVKSFKTIHGKAMKRKAAAVAASETSDEEEEEEEEESDEEEEGSEESEYVPSGKRGANAPSKRRRASRRKGMPRGLEIDMVGW
ncbi:MAG: hypothetical protein Q9222_007936, partial [Ikaeria aurantiellina]